MKLKALFPSAALHGVLALLLACASVAAHAQANSIESINVSPATGGRVVVRVTLKQAPASSLEFSLFTANS